MKDGIGNIILFDMYPNLANVQDIADRIEIAQGNITEAGQLFGVVRKHDISDIFHLAWLMPTLCESSPDYAIYVNCTGTYNVFEVARVMGIRRVVWASSVAVYGFYPTTWKDEDEPLSEESLPLATTIYGASKLFNERMAENYALRYGLDHIALRLHSVFGLGRAQRAASPLDVLSQLIEVPASGKPYLAPPPWQRLTWLYKEDMADAFLLAHRATKPASRIFNLGGEVRTVGETVSYMKALLPECQIGHIQEPITRPVVVTMDLIKEQLGYQPRYSMEQGIKEYLEQLLGQKL